VQKSTKQEIYKNIFCILAIDFPQLFNSITPKPLSFNVSAQLYHHYDKKLSPECIHLFLGKWTNRIEYHKAILKEDHRIDLIDAQTGISDSHKRHALKNIQQMLKPPE